MRICLAWFTSSTRASCKFWRGVNRNLYITEIIYHLIPLNPPRPNESHAIWSWVEEHKNLFALVSNILLIVCPTFRTSFKVYDYSMTNVKLQHSIRASLTCMLCNILHLIHFIWRNTLTVGIFALEFFAFLSLFFLHPSPYSFGQCFGLRLLIGKIWGSTADKLIELLLVGLSVSATVAGQKGNVCQRNDSDYLVALSC